MSITAVREGNTLRLIEASSEIPEGATVVLFTEDELSRSKNSNPLDTLQLDRAFAEEDVDWGPLLDPITLGPESNRA